jgi:protein-tyrosine phosphatase/membrane-associated phospholipid phosphatase
MAQTENIESRSRGTRSTWKALAASLELGALFLIIYGLCNWFTAQRARVPTLFFEWERSIPFVPLMIIPYMSIDLFFVTAPFLCRSDRELVALSKRIATAILIAGLCFLLFPLRFAFERSQVRGWLGAFFDWFQGIDRPYNLLPSLHIALCLILAELFVRHTRGLLRHALIIWFVLIGLSAVLTYQHHVLDVVTGFALGAYCLYFFRESDARLPVVPNRRVGSYYLVGAFVVVSLAVLLWPWGVFLIWPTVSLGIAAAAYFGAGPGIFRKRDGRLPWTTWWALGPVLLGQEISRLHYRRQCRAWDELTPRIWIGGVLSRSEAATAVREGVTAVLDLTAEFSEAAPFRAVNYRNVPVLDLTAPTFEQLEEMTAFLEQESSKGVVYVHCKIGYSRTAAAAAAFLLRTGRVRAVSEAVHLLRQVRPTIVIRPEVVTVLDEFARNRTVSPRLHEVLLQ